MAAARRGRHRRPTALRAAILRRYGKDRTFSVPILTVLALTGKLGDDAARGLAVVPQLPFELAALPARLVSASPAAGRELRAAGADRDRPGAASLRAVAQSGRARAARTAFVRVTHRLLRAMQPESGGYLEATPLTSFVVMSLAGMGQTDSPVVEAGVRFLVESMRDDGSWPIDTNLATWVTTLSIGALAEAGALPPARSRVDAASGCSVSRARASIRSRTRRRAPGRGRR